MKTIICHVSDKKYDILIPQPPENAICFSENKFITYFGQFLYLFDLDTMIKNFNIRKLPTSGLTSTHYLNYDERIQFKSQSLGHEWRIFGPIEVDKHAIGVIEHWNHANGTIGKGSIEGPMNKIIIDLMRSREDIKERMAI